jgi:hypothetical protein
MYFSGQLENFSYDLRNNNVSKILKYTITCDLTKNLRYYDFKNGVLGSDYYIEYNNLENLKQGIDDICYYIGEPFYIILYEFLNKYNYYMVLFLDYIIITIQDHPFIIIKNINFITDENSLQFHNYKFKNADYLRRLNTNRSIVLEISKLKYNLLLYINDNNIFKYDPIPSYRHRFYNKIISGHSRTILSDNCIIL